jgi:ATP-dependent RNA helicase DDX52/ROK1
MDSFSILKDGVSFDRKRFSRDFELFSPLKKQAKITPPTTSNIRKEFSIFVTGSDVPEPMASWAEVFNKHVVPETVQRTLRSLYENLTAIQMQGFPVMLARRDVIGIAPTGSGKTLSFVLPLITILTNSETFKGLRAVVVAPTKELARQLFKEVLVLSEGTGLAVELLSKKGRNSNEIRTQVDVLICTPLLMVHLFDQEVLEDVKFVVLDEADQLFELGYMEQVDCILKKINPACTKWMFSATMNSSVEILAYSMLIDPVKISVGLQNATVTTVTQELLFSTNESGKIFALKQMVQEGKMTPPVLIFVQSKDRAIQLSEEMKKFIKNVSAMHSGLDDRQRSAIVQNFRTGSVWVLICTDLLSRGIDFLGVKLVINYDFPQTIVSYIHRIGRAGRAGEQAKAVTLYTLEDAPYIKMVANVMKKSGMTVPDWMLKLKNPNKSLKKKLEKKPIRRENISLSHRLSRSFRKYLKHKKEKTLNESH